jgi:hypothetical protein
MRAVASQTGDFLRLKSATDATTLLAITAGGLITQSNTALITGHFIGQNAANATTTMTIGAAGGAGNTPLALRGHTSQTANLQVWSPSDGNTYLAVGSLTSASTHHLFFRALGTQTGMFIQMVANDNATVVYQVASDGRTGVGGAANSVYKLQVTGGGNDVTSAGARFINTGNGNATAAFLAFVTSSSGTEVSNFLATYAQGHATAALAGRTVLGTNNAAGSTGCGIQLSATTHNFTMLFAGTTKYTFANDLLTFADQVNIAFNTSNGTKIGTATGQKIGFWNAAPVEQQVLATGAGNDAEDIIALLQTLGLCRQTA